MDELVGHGTRLPDDRLAFFAPRFEVRLDPVAVVRIEGSEWVGRGQLEQFAMIVHAVTPELARFVLILATALAIRRFTVSGGSPTVRAISLWVIP